MEIATDLLADVLYRNDLDSKVTAVLLTSAQVYPEIMKRKVCPGIDGYVGRGQEGGAENHAAQARRGRP